MFSGGCILSNKLRKMLQAQCLEEDLSKSHFPTHICVLGLVSCFHSGLQKFENNLCKHFINVLKVLPTGKETVSVVSKLGNELLSNSLNAKSV